MRRILLISAIVPAIALPVLGLSWTAQAPGSDQVVIDCGGKPVVMPGPFMLACADGNAYLTHLRWTSWRQARADATGTETLNDCTPYCAAGTFHSYPVRVILSGNAPVTGHPGQRRYAVYTLCYSGRPPSFYSGKAKVPGRRCVTGSLWDPPQPPS